MQEPASEQACDWIRNTTTKLLKIGAGLPEFLRCTEHMVFSKELIHKLAAAIEAREKRYVEQS
jgi:hypothetical protein